MVGLAPIKHRGFLREQHQRFVMPCCPACLVRRAGIVVSGVYEKKSALVLRLRTHERQVEESKEIIKKRMTKIDRGLPNCRRSRLLFSSLLGFRPAQQASSAGA